MTRLIIPYGSVGPMSTLEVQAAQKGRGVSIGMLCNAMRPETDIAAETCLHCF